MKGGQINSEDKKSIYGIHDMKCAPGVKFENGSCYKLDQLVQMAGAWNKENPNKIIKLSTTAETIKPGQYKRYLLNSFKRLISDKCDSHQCWTTLPFFKNYDGDKNILKKYTFRPEGPSGQFTWLNTMNIDEVMKQYEKSYPGFYFMGTVPSDFDTVPESYGNVAETFSEKSIKKLIGGGYSTLGAVFNLDRHDQSGSHWVSLITYPENKEKTNYKIFFFDSYGVRPKKEFRKLMLRIRDVLSQQGVNPKNIKAEYNKVQHQSGGSECGVYSMVALVEGLKAGLMQDYNNIKLISNDPNKALDDNYINQARKIFFSNGEEVFDNAQSNPSLENTKRRLTRKT